MKRPKVDKEKTKDMLKRSFWLFMVALFVVTGLGIGLVGFWQATHPPKDDTSQTDNSQQPKLKGTKLTGFETIPKIDSLQMVDRKVGTGAEVKPDSRITVHYTGALASSGVIFESSLDGGQPLADYPLANLIEGWQKGLLGMKAGGERRLLIPAAMGYGASGTGGIPPNSDLVFDILLFSSQTPAQ